MRWRSAGLAQFETSDLHVTPADVLAKTQSGASSSESMVPAQVVRTITQRGLFGYSGAGPTQDSTT
jgi:hypothetical protein